MSSVDLKPYELMQMVADFLERESVPYRIVGSMASIAYGEPRFTNDVDVLVDLPQEKVELLLREFPSPDFYISIDAAHEAIRTRRQFNILHPPSGLKVDMIMTSDSEFSRLDITHGQRLKSEGFYDALFASPENVVLKKLLFFQDGCSDKHLRDSAGILLIQGDRIDQDYLEEWAEKLGVADELQLVRERLQN
jgi:hypothetical protein